MTAKGIGHLAWRTFSAALMLMGATSLNISRWDFDPRWVGVVYGLASLVCVAAAILFVLTAIWRAASDEA